MDDAKHEGKETILVDGDNLDERMQELKERLISFGLKGLQFTSCKKVTGS
jgi:hypothetical protein